MNLYLTLNKAVYNSGSLVSCFPVCLSMEGNTRSYMNKESELYVSFQGKSKDSIMNN